MPKFSVISCVSDFEVYQKCLVDSIYGFENKDLFELIPVDNSTGTYTAAQALNLAISLSKSDSIVCCHQDISLLPGFFESAAASIGAAGENWGIIGCAGPSIEMDENDKPYPVGRVYSGKPDRYGNDFDVKLTRVYDGKVDLTEVYCVDECLFLINKRHNIGFNPEFDGFHFYGADFCLNMKSAGHKVYASCLPIIHHGEFSTSTHSGDIEYWRLFKKFIKLWRPKYDKHFFGTHMHWVRTKDKNSEIGGMDISTYIPKTAIGQNFSAKILYSTINEKMT